MEEHDISTCVLSAPASGNNATGQEARDIARRTNEVGIRMALGQSGRVQRMILGEATSLAVAGGGVSTVND